ncbi:MULTISPECIES: TrbI/VirB10 family protein [Candidatus Ichthyocystis]|uniref:Putative conjugal transfer protein TrbI n=1 Tax=Candidatus Ichthyocystis hellenicum TaxID=1561003 RepID=A0A0S4M5T8_9BURK|nr:MULTISPECIES: TrbI/VirB10 family protein [Ichthyocystis]CUT17496.1 putative conjugal transfer protein TrbI [Candidatus Ichthyocystis hellenicum]
MRANFVRRLSWLLLWFCLLSTMLGYVLRHRRDVQDKRLVEDRRLAAISRQKPSVDIVKDVLDKQMILPQGGHHDRGGHIETRHKDLVRRAFIYQRDKELVSAFMSPMIAYQDDEVVPGREGISSPCLLIKGASIPVVLMMSVVSPPDGIVRAQVTANVYDSVSLSRVVIPVGSKFIGHIDRKSSVFAGKLLIQFDQFVLPNGKILTGNDFYSADYDGSTGNSATVDHHFWQNFSPRFVLSGMSVVGSLLSGVSAGRNDPYSPANVNINDENDFPDVSINNVLGNVSDHINGGEKKYPVTIRLDLGQSFIIINQKTVNFRCPVFLNPR